MSVVALAVAFVSVTGVAEAFEARGSVGQVYVTGLDAGARASLLARSGRTVATRRANAQGGLLFRRVKPGTGYRVRLGRRGARSAPLRVLSKRSAPPSTDVYNQSIPPSGYGYLTTRDGTQLAINVHPPQNVANALPGVVQLPAAPAGPTPTLIEYSGYGYADPAGPQSGIAILANLMGFTVVDVNMRGTGCSGGAFDFFEPLQSLDGYDVVEAVSRQPWVMHNKVGMMGISYGGISQLFTAQTRPPSLAAIAPLSVIDATQTTLYPGGILNTGFAVAWAKERIHDAKPASEKEGQPWAHKRIQEGDDACRANQALHGEAANLMKKIRSNSHYRPSVADPLAPVTFVKKINVPVFMACQFTDEQTGGHCPTLAKRFTGTQRKWFTFTNGTHVDSLAPETFNRMYDFFKLYVARQAPITGAAAIQGAGPVIYQEAMGIPGVTMPPDPIQQQPTYEGALAAFEALPPIRILFDNGAGGTSPGQPKPGFEQSFPRLPIPGTKARSWYFAAGGKLADRRPRRAHSDRFAWNTRARPLTNFTGNTAAGENGLWTATPPYNWAYNPRGSGRLVRELAAEREHDGDRLRCGARLGALVPAQPRPAGDDQRGQAGRQGDLRTGRLAAGERAQARQAQEHAARAGAEPAQARRPVVPAQALREGRDPALLPGARLPGRLAHPRDDLSPQRRPAHLGLQGDQARQEGREGGDRPFQAQALTARAAGGAGRERPDRPATLPRPPGPALPGLPALRIAGHDRRDALRIGVVEAAPGDMLIGPDQG